MKKISMKTAVLAVCVFLGCGCSKTMDAIPNSVSHIGTAVVNAEIHNLSSDEIGVAAASLSAAKEGDELQKAKKTNNWKFIAAFAVLFVTVAIAIACVAGGNLAGGLVVYFIGATVLNVVVYSICIDFDTIDYSVPGGEGDDGCTANHKGSSS
jgi:outer membrane murein-binding lipoprotein Lpp